MLKIHSSPSSIRNTSKQQSKNQNSDSIELACSIDISKIETPNDSQMKNNLDKYPLDPPFSMQEVKTEETHQLANPNNKALNRIITHSKAVEAHKTFRQEVLASTAPSDNIPQDARLTSLLFSKQTLKPHDAPEKISINPSTARKSAQLTKSVETLVDKPKARTANKRHTEPIKISTLKLCRDIEKKQRMRDNKPYVDLGSSDDDSDEMMEKIYEVPFSPELEGAVIMENLPEEGEMDEIELESAEDFETNKLDKVARRWNKFIIKSSASPTKEKYQPSFVVHNEEEKLKNKTIQQSQSQGKGISREMIPIKNLLNKDPLRNMTPIQSYKAAKLNTTPCQSPTSQKDGRIDQLMMLDSAWNGLETRGNETSTDEKLAAFVQEKETPKIIQRSQSLENLQGGRKIRQSIQTMKPMVSGTTQSEESSPSVRHGSLTNRQKDVEKALKILDVNFPSYTSTHVTGKMINIKELIEQNRPKTRIVSAERKPLIFDHMFQISPNIHSRKNPIVSTNKSDASPRKERPAFRIVDLEGVVTEKKEIQRASSQKYLEGYLARSKSTVVQKKELNSMARKDNGLARK